MQSNVHNAQTQAWFQAERNKKISFYFQVRGLKFLRERDFARHDRLQWLPPRRSRGFEVDPSEETLLYYWRDGILSDVTGHYPTSRLEPFGVASMFWHDEKHKFLAVDFDASQDDADEDNDWQEVRYNHHENGDTYISSPGGYPRLGRPGNPNWLGHVVPRTHDFQYDGQDEAEIVRQYNGHAVPRGGISGGLPIVIGSVAYSCPENSLFTALDMSFKKWYWVRHPFLNDRHDHQKGKIIKVWYDFSSSQEDKVRLQWYSQGYLGAIFA